MSENDNRGSIFLSISEILIFDMNFMTDASGMDFRAMLKKRKYQKWAREQAEQEKVDLKEVEKPMPALKKVEKVRGRVLSYILHIRSVVLLGFYKQYARISGITQ